jgi:hypothetical protein
MTEPLKPNQRMIDGQVHEFAGVYVPPWVHKALLEICRVEHRSMSELIVQQFTESLEQERPKVRKKCVHLQLPSGAMVRCSPDIDAHTLEALDEMVLAAVRALEKRK